MSNGSTKTVNVDLETWKRLMMLKVRFNAYDFDEVINRLIKDWEKVEGSLVMP